MPEAPRPQELPPHGGESVSRAWAWVAVSFAVVVTAALIAKFRPEIERMRLLEQRVEALAREEAVWEQRLAARAREHRRLADSPAIREAVARDLLDLRKPGETIFRPLEGP